MMLSFMRKVVDRAFPKGPPHEPKEGGDYANWRDATATNLETIREDVINLKFVRDPSHAPLELIPDLELEWGVAGNVNLNETQRREAIESIRFAKATTGNDDDLQSLLDKAGFDLTVYNNSPDGPAIDPAILIDQNFQVQMNQTEAYTGQDEAYFGRLGGDLLVNRTVFIRTPGYFSMGNIWTGLLQPEAHFGHFEEMISTEIDYPIPTDPAAWPFVFFVGGDAIFNPDGSIATIEQGFVLSTQQKQFETLILKFKPLYTWCGLIVTYT